MASLEDPVSVGGLDVPNRLYRAPLLECAGTNPDTADRLVRELEPAAASGVGLVVQGAAIVRSEGGCAAPGMTRMADPEFVSGLEAVPEAIHDHGGRVFCQLEHGGLRSLEVWHAAHRKRNPDRRQLAVSRPPPLLRALDRAGFLDFDTHVLSTADVYDLAADFGRCAGYAVRAGYDGIHVAGANMGIIQQFLSPYYNRRTDEFGDGTRFLEAIHDAVREFAGSVPLVAKVPAETEAPPFVRPRLTLPDGVEIARRLERIGYDGLVPVTGSPFWDMNLVRGKYPERAWAASDLRAGYEAAFGGRLRARLVAAANRLQAWQVEERAAWNAEFCRRVREQVSIPVWCEGGIRSREGIDALLGDTTVAGTEANEREPAAERGPAADLVGLGRPFYAEPRLGARLLDGDTDGQATREAGETGETDDRPDGKRAGAGTGGIEAGGIEAESPENRNGRRVLCENCNNCTVPQVTGARGTCRTPSVVRERARLEKQGVYDD